MDSATLPSWLKISLNHPSRRAVAQNLVKHYQNQSLAEIKQKLEVNSASR